MIDPRDLLDAAQVEGAAEWLYVYRTYDHRRGAFRALPDPDRRPYLEDARNLIMHLARLGAGGPASSPSSAPSS